MSKKRIQKWYISSLFNAYHAVRNIDGNFERVQISAHCLACAKSELLLKYGGRVDLRGWDKQGFCGKALKATQAAVNTDDN